MKKKEKGVIPENDKKLSVKILQRNYLINMKLLRDLSSLSFSKSNTIMRVFVLLTFNQTESKHQSEK